MTALNALTPDRWRLIQDLVHRALALDAAERTRFVATECGTDLSLREQVLALLLASGDGADEFERQIEGAIAESTRDPDLPEGYRLDRYRIVGLIGRGGMGAVYLAERADQQYQQRVAIKTIARGFVAPQLAARFRAERQILARLSHPNVAHLLDGGHTADGAPYLVMEHVQGKRIDDYCLDAALPLRRRLELFRQVCAAVDYAHRHLVVHRDLKPSNILVTADGTPKLLDFGIAKLLDPANSPHTVAATRVRDRMMTPDHASPEQIRGEPVGTATDVYALGVLLYEILTGSSPFAGPRDRPLPELVRQICEVGAPPPSTIAAELRGDLDRIVMKAMHRDAEQRYPTAAALSEDVLAFLEDRPVRARPDSIGYRARKFVSRHRVGVGVGAFAIAAVIALTAFYTARLAAERDVAELERRTATRVSEFLVESFRLANPNETGGEKITAREALDAAAARIDADLATEPRIRIVLMRRMGESYAGLGLWPKARDILQRAVEQQRALSPGADAELARALSQLGHVEYNLGRLDAADAIYREALAMHDALGRGTAVDAIRTRHSLAVTLRQRQRYPEAIVEHERAEALARSLSPADPATLGLVLEGFAMTLTESGDHARAESHVRDALPLVRGRTYAGYDLESNALNTLATVLTKQLRLAEAEPLHRRLLERQVHRHGPDNVIVGRTWNNLSHALRAKGDYAAAEQALREAMRVFALTMGRDSPDMATAHHNLGGLRLESGRASDALAALDTSLALKRRLYGARGAQLVSTLGERAGALRQLGRLADAEASLREAESIAAESFAANDRRHAALLAERGRLALARGRVQDAVSDLERALERTSPTEAARYATVQVGLADARLAAGDRNGATELVTQALAARERVLPAGHPLLAVTRTRLDELRRAAD